MNYLLDTCLISELVKKAFPNPGVVAWLNQQDEDRLFLSAITIGEIQAGISKLIDSARKTDLLSWLDNDLRRRFSNRILPIDLEVALVWGSKRGDASRNGVTLPFADSLIAATALAHGMTVVSRNASDLQRCGAMILNPWS